MRGTFRLAEPDEAMATLTATMRLREWKKIRAEMPTPGVDWRPDGHSVWVFIGLIDQLIAQAEQEFEHSEASV